MKQLRQAVPMYFAKLGSVVEAHTFCEELALKKVFQPRVKYVQDFMFIAVILVDISTTIC